MKVERDMPTVSLIFSDLELRCIPSIDHIQEFGLLGLHTDYWTCPTCGMEFDIHSPTRYTCEQCGTDGKHFQQIRTAG